MTRQKRRVEVLRDQRRTELFSTALVPGDIIIVPPKGPSLDDERMFDRFVNVTGEIKQPDLSPIEVPDILVISLLVRMRGTLWPRFLIARLRLRLSGLRVSVSV